MPLLVTTLSLLVFDIVATTWLLVRRTRRRTTDPHRRRAAVTGVVRVQLDPVDAALPPPRAALPRATANEVRVPGSLAELRVAADRLAAVEDLRYDPALWEA